MKTTFAVITMFAALSAGAAAAAGPAGFARIAAASVPAATAVGDRADAGIAGLPELSFAQRRELMRVNFAVNEAIAGVDAYFDGFAPRIHHIAAAPSYCFDCADIKREQLVSRGWPRQAMRIGFAIGEEGSIDRVLVIATGRGDVILRNDRPVVEGGAAKPAARRAPAAPSGAAMDI